MTMRIPEPRAVAQCSDCGGDIYEGERCGLREGRVLCTDCLESRWNALSTPRRFEALGFEPVILPDEEPFAHPKRHI